MIECVRMGFLTGCIRNDGAHTFTEMAALPDADAAADEEAAAEVEAAGGAETEEIP